MKKECYILAATQYPDLDTGAATSDQKEDCTVNALGERTSMNDRDCDVPSHSYDVLGRQTLDAITTLGSGLYGGALKARLIIQLGKPTCLTMRRWRASGER